MSARGAAMQAAAAAAAAATAGAQPARQRRVLQATLARLRGGTGHRKKGRDSTLQLLSQPSHRAAPGPLPQERTEGNGVKRFSVVRWDPARLGRRPYIATYPVRLSECGPMVLDALRLIQDAQDSSLYVPRDADCAQQHPPCGGCLVGIDGATQLACRVYIDTDCSRVHRIYPPCLPVLEEHAPEGR